MQDENSTNALYTSEQTRQLDQIAIEEFGIPSLGLMKLAGDRAFRLLMQHFADSQKIVVACGAGNNGGDGYVVAFLLHKSGMPVQVIALEQPLTADAKTVRQEFEQAGGVCSQDLSVVDQADLIVDGLFGAGLSRAPEGEVANLINRINRNSKARKYSLDLPSGLDGDTGQGFNPSVKADLTITFIGRKIGLTTAAGPDLSGDVIVEQLDLPGEVFDRVKPKAYLMPRPEIAQRSTNTHKGQFGHVYIAGGDRGMLGAILLAGSAALRSGVGMATVISLESHLDLPALHLPELMSSYFDQGLDVEAIMSPGAALVLGPGTVDNDWGRDLFNALSRQAVSRVLDAGALRQLAANPSTYTAQILTPHPGEAAALLNTTTQTIQSHRVQSAIDISNRYGGVCVLKGAGTIIADGDKIAIADVGNPGMSSAGTGDVLSGIIGALLAQGLSPFDAAKTGVWLHGRAGDIAADKCGQHGMIASDIIDALPTAISDCLR